MHRAFSKFIILASLLFCLVIHADTTIETVQTDGFANTRDNAVANALAEAIRQVTGTAIDSSKLITDVITQSAQSIDGHGNQTYVVDQNVSKRLDMKTSGAVKGYRIVSQEQMQNGQWHVVVSAQVAKYSTPGLPTDKRRKIAMIQFTPAAATFMLGPTKMDARRVTYDLLSSFNKHFTQSRRFAVLSRQDNAALESEKTLISNNSPVEEMAKLGQMLGLDYMVVGAVKDFFVAQPQTTTIAISGAQYTSIPRAYVELDYRIVAVATSQIKWADVVRLDMPPQQIAQFGGDYPTIYNALIDMACRGIAQALDNIYPINLLMVMPNGECVLDQGGSLIIPGSVYDAMILGPEIVNPMNGESLGRAEQHLCFVQVTRVDAKMSYAIVVPNSGTITPDHIKQGIILRQYRGGLTPAQPQPQAQPAAPVIKLPFDR